MRNRNTQPITVIQSRYGCQEVQQDCELVIADRVAPDIRGRYFEHLDDCPDCRRFHRVLNAVYAGPELPHITTSFVEREFEAVVERRRAAEFDALRPRLSAFFRQPMAVAIATAFAFVLLVFATSFSPADDFDAEGAEARQLASLSGGIDHHAQNFARVLAGEVQLEGDDRLAPSPGGFRVGTGITVASDEPVQVVFMGKIIASLQPNSRVEWTHVSADLIELSLERGMLAARYDRLPKDPVLQVRTRDSVTRVLGTVFTVEVTDDESSRVSVLRGRVAVLDPTDHHVITKVEPGWRYHVASGRFSDVGRNEVSASLPLSSADPGNGPDDVAPGFIPTSWTVPGLSDERHRRTLEQIPDPGPLDMSELSDTPSEAGRHAPESESGRPSSRRSSARNERRRRRARGNTPGQRTNISNMGFEDKAFDWSSAQRPEPLGLTSAEEDSLRELIAQAVRQARTNEHAVLANEMERQRNRCSRLYDSPKTRFLAANCLVEFVNRYADNAEIHLEGRLAVGILRMDYARDYQLAIKAFEHFLENAADHHPQAELASYRLVLALVESGDVRGAIARARTHLERFPAGAHVGHIIQRFPELKSLI